MQESLTVATVTTPAPQTHALPAARSRWRPRLRWLPQVWMQWMHRWSTLTLGVLLLVTTFSGTVTLFTFDLNRLTHPQLYKPTPAATLISLDQARAAVIAGIASDPALTERGVHPSSLIVRAGDTYQFYLSDKDDESAGEGFVDPGTGKYLGQYDPESTIWGWFERLHIDLFADKITFTFPAWVPEWTQTLIGANLGELLLKIVALLLLSLVITGAYLWWPGIHKLVYGVTIRRGIKGYAWHYDWHKVLGFVSLPFLCMWAITGLNFYEPFSDGISAAWYTATFTAKPPESPEDLQSVPTGGAQITAEKARQITLEAVPNVTFISVDMPTVVTRTVGLWVGQGYDPYTYGEWPGQVSVTLDAYSGKVLDSNLPQQSTWSSYIYEWWFSSAHMGFAVSWPVRLLWAIFGLMPTFLAFTGVVQWWLKRKQHKARARTRVRTGSYNRADWRVASKGVLCVDLKQLTR